MIIKLKLRGFTLAEVLITLGIIGVVAAMTIPTLIANTRSQQYRSRLKKTISTLSQAARMSQAQYGYDYAGITQRCGTNGGTEHPETTQSICAILNGTLTGSTYYNEISTIPMSKNNNSSIYSIDSTYLKGLGSTTNMHAYILSDGTIVGFATMLGKTPCTLPIGETLKDTHPTAGSAFLADCYGFIDVNGSNLPNKEVTCSSGSNSLAQSTCVVKNNAKHMTDIYPIRFHDGIAEPATAAARYVLKTAK